MRWVYLMMFFGMFAASLWSLVLMIRMQRKLVFVFSMLRVWAERWGQPDPEVRQALDEILRKL